MIVDVVLAFRQASGLRQRPRLVVKLPDTVNASALSAKLWDFVKREDTRSRWATWRDALIRAVRGPRIIFEGTISTQCCYQPRVIKHHFTKELDAEVAALFKDFSMKAKGGRPHLRVVALKAHIMHGVVFQKLADLCRRKEIVFIATCTNDPSVDPAMTMIGLDGPECRAIKRAARTLPDFEPSVF